MTGSIAKANAFIWPVGIYGANDPLAPYPWAMVGYVLLRLTIYDPQ